MFSGSEMLAAGADFPRLRKASLGAETKSGVARSRPDLVRMTARVTEGALGSMVMDPGVRGGELEGVEENRGPFKLDAVACKGGDEEGDGDLDGFSVFDRREFELDGRGGFG